jgi:hypothetical protein
MPPQLSLTITLQLPLSAQTPQELLGRKSLTENPLLAANVGDVTKR